MRVLWISNETPDRYGQGGQRRQYFQIRSLVARGHLVHIACIASRQDPQSVSALASVERLTTHIGPIVRPFARNRALRVAHSGSFDRVIVAHIESWDLLRGHADRIDAPVLLDLHNVMSRWYERRGQPERSEAWRARESSALLAANAVTVCSTPEAHALPPVGAARRLLLPHGIDSNEWRTEPQIATSPVVALFGNWAWEPNRWGLEWFADQVWPRVLAEMPRAEARIAGTGVPNRVATMPSVKALGRVADLSAFFSTACVLAVPVRTGVGAPMKFSEALASGVSVLATTDAADAAPGSPATVSDDPTIWATTICDRLSDPVAAHREGILGRTFALTRLPWDQVTAPLHDWVELP